MKVAYFKNRSTTIVMVQHPLDLGRAIMKSMLTLFMNEKEWVMAQTIQQGTNFSLFLSSTQDKSLERVPPHLASTDNNKKPLTRPKCDVGQDVKSIKNYDIP